MKSINVMRPFYTDIVCGNRYISVQEQEANDIALGDIIKVEEYRHRVIIHGSSLSTSKQYTGRLCYVKVLEKLTREKHPKIVHAGTVSLVATLIR